MMRFLLLAALSITAAAQDYVGSKACAGCHRATYDRWVKSPMGRSLAPAEPLASLAPTRITVTNDRLKRTFEVYAENGHLMQSESGEGFRSAHRVDWAIGSGVNGYSFIVRRGDHLMQAPLSFYARAGKWDLSPGYEFADYAFNRPIHAACIHCHSGSPQPVAKQPGLFANPPFREAAIGCENCHGPGAKHVAERGASVAIVNPAKLSAERADEVCMNCHQGGDARVLKPGKAIADFRPGLILDDVVAIFKMPRDAASADSDLLEHHESMRLSRCFEVSGKLQCTTCHKPHAATVDYRAACLSCHREALPAPHPAKSSDCVSCHMPKRDVGVIAHSALTNHRIVRTRSQPMPQRIAPPGELIHFNRVAGRSLPLLTRLEAYGQLADAQPVLLERFNALLDQAAKEHPESATVLGALGRRTLRASDHVRAIDLLERAIRAGSVAAATHEDLSEALARAGRLEESAAVLEKGIALAPYTQTLYKALALRWIKLERYADARKTLERYVELFPEDDFVRRLLKQVSGAR